MSAWKMKIITKEEAKKQLIVSYNAGRIVKTAMNWTGLSADTIQQKGASFIHSFANNYIGYDMEEAKVASHSVVKNVNKANTSKSLENKMQRLSELTGFKLTPNELKTRFLTKFATTENAYRIKYKDVCNEFFPNYLRSIYQDTLAEIYNLDSMKNLQGLTTEAAYNKICGAAMLLGACMEQFAIDMSNDPYCNDFISRPTSFMSPQTEEENKYNRPSFSSREFVMTAVKKQCKNIKLKSGERPDYSALFSEYENAHEDDLSMVKSEDYWVKKEEDRLHPSLWSYIKKEYIKRGALLACDYLAGKALSLGTGAIDNVLDATHRSHSVNQSEIIDSIKEKMSGNAETKLTFSSELVNKLKDTYGFEATTESLNERFLHIIEQNKDMTVATNETWSKTILPKNLKALFNEIKNEILPKAAAKGVTPKESMQEVESALADIGKLIEGFSENLANFEDVDFFEKPLCFNPDSEKNQLFKRQHLIDPKEIERLKVTHATMQHPNLNIKNSELLNLVNKNLKEEIELPDAENGSKRLPYVFGEHPLEDESRFLDSIYHVRDAKKAHENRGFFYRLFRRSKYKNEKHEIETATELLKSCYDAERVERFLDTKESFLDVSQEERKKYGANKNADQIANEINEKALEEKELCELEQDRIDARKNVEKELSQAKTDELKTRKEIEEKLKQYDNLFKFAESIKLAPTEEKVDSKIETHEIKAQDQANNSDLKDKQQEPNNKEPEQGGIFSGIKNAFSTVYNGTKNAASTMLNVAKNVTYTVVDQVRYAGKVAYNIGASGYRKFNEYSGCFFSTVADWYATPKGFDETKFNNFKHNVKYKELQNEKHSDGLSMFMAKCYNSKLRIASSLEDVTSDDIKKAAAFDVITCLQDGFQSNVSVRADLYLKMKQSFDNDPRLTEAAILKDISKKAEAYDNKKKSQDPSARSILDVESARTSLDKETDICDKISREVIDGYFSSWKDAKDKLKKRIKAEHQAQSDAKENKSDKPEVLMGP